VGGYEDNVNVVIVFGHVRLDDYFVRHGFAPFRICWTRCFVTPYFAPMRCNVHPRPRSRRMFSA
jgi:hypothetical protein